MSQDAIMPSKKSILSFAKPVVERFPHVANAYRAMRDQIDVAKAMPSPWGFTLAGNAAMAQGAFEPEETTLVREMLREVDVLVNVGANVGYYCCHALSMKKTAIAFEPVQRNVRYLCQNIKSNGWSCEIYPMALSNGVGVLEMFGGDTGASVVKGWAGIPERYVSLAPYSTMDLVLGDRLAHKAILVIIDVEGAEKWVLEGSSKLLASRPRPSWLIEIAVAEHQPSGVQINPRLIDTFRHMFDAGYSAFTADSQLRPVTMQEVERAASGDINALPTHNFLFR
jgi:FkbM family methyltransferase